MQEQIIVIEKSHLQEYLDKLISNEQVPEPKNSSKTLVEYPFVVISGLISIGSLLGLIGGFVIFVFSLLVFPVSIILTILSGIVKIFSEGGQKLKNMLKKENKIK